MPRLVLLTEGFTGRTFELKSERSTVGRLEENTIQIPAPSLSSHHCEILLTDGVVTIRDLDSTNGCYVNGEQITEKSLAQGEIVRFGAIEARLEESKGPGSSGKKQLDQTSVLPQGVNLNDLEQGTQRISLSKGGPFKRKGTKGKAIWITIAAVVVTGVVATLVYAFVLN